MYYIVFDLEFNQDIPSLQDFDRRESHYPFEIIQIGAVKLDLNFHTVATFNRYIKPTIYKKISPFITELTGITTEQLQVEEPFPAVFKAYLKFIEDTDSVFCTWGMSDMKELFRNTEDHQLSSKFLPRMYINLQPYVSTLLDFPPKTLVRLQHAVEALNIPLTFPFHNAIHDAYYTAELFKKTFNSSFQPKLYDPSFVALRPRQRKRKLDTEELLQQFEKMFSRTMTDEEQELILLAYKMGKTNQFLK